ncbi:MAG: hypothetical protein M1825_006071 [Sarcosagium campestre]|nr:MAG: hypothetical protein M1825_006071 [Sarcosagium campestre]
MSSKRASVLPQGPRPPTTIARNAIIADAASMVGTHRITIGESTVLHPRSKLLSHHSTVTLGASCIICERSIVGLSSPGADGDDEAAVVLKDCVTVDVGAVVEASSIGEGTFIEVNAKIGRGAVIGKHCKISPLCEVAAGEVIPDYTVIYGTGQRRIDRSDVDRARIGLTKLHAETLRKLIPTNLAKWQT